MLQGESHVKRSQVNHCLACMLMGAEQLHECRMVMSLLSSELYNPIYC